MTDRTAILLAKAIVDAIFAAAPVAQTYEGIVKRQQDHDRIRYQLDHLASEGAWKEQVKQHWKEQCR